MLHHQRIKGHRAPQSFTPKEESGSHCLLVLDLNNQLNWFDNGESHTVDVVPLLEYLWNWTESVFREKELGAIKDVALIDYINVFGIESFHRTLTLLENPFDERTSLLLGSIKADNENFDDYAPLIVLNRYYRAKGDVPYYLIELFTKCSHQTFWCLASIVAGKPIGYYRNYKNLKDIVNVVCNSYSYIAKSALYLIDIYSRKETLTQPTGNPKPGRKYRNQYERLQMCAEVSEACQLSNEDLNILFPKKTPSLKINR